MEGKSSRSGASKAGSKLKDAGCSMAEAIRKLVELDDVTCAGHMLCLHRDTEFVIRGKRRMGGRKLDEANGRAAILRWDLAWRKGQDEHDDREYRKSSTCVNER